MGFEFEEGKMYTMPVYFGPAEDRIHPTFQPPAEIEELRVVFETDAASLEALLPKGFSLREPLLSVSFAKYGYCGWLAGNSYTLINISTPVRFDGDEDHIDGAFLLTMFENHADPILPGRDAIGYCKIYADIPPFRKYENFHSASASSWGFDFLDLNIDTDGTAADPDRIQRMDDQNQGKLNLKYIPETGNGFCHPDVCYPTLNPKEWHKPDGYAFELSERTAQFCSGTVRFHCPDEVEMPTYARIARYFAGLEIKEYLGAQYLTYSDPCDYTHVRRLH
jgi:acetoacetate decarboxylase